MVQPLESGERTAATEPRHIDLFGATMIGVGAMVGAGIFVLVGVALRSAGPSAFVAFALNGVLALVTAFAFAELATAFPEAGGGYTYAKKVFPIGGGFAAGWVLWFAYCVAAALYALGFGSFLAHALAGLAARIGVGADLASHPWLPPIAGALVTGIYMRLLSTRGASAGNLVSLLKLVVFAALIAVGLWVLRGRPAGTAAAGFTPFFPHGIGGAFAAMGFTFIALEGFEVITAVSDEVRQPERTIPRAMFLSVGITLVVYLGLLFVLLAVGGPADGRPAWLDLGEYGEAAVAVAARRFAGPAGDVVVTAAGLLATFTALGAAMLGGSRVAYAMGSDRALPRALASVSGTSGNPVTAVRVTAGIAAAVAALTGDAETAGAAASLAFLLCFALTNAAGLLVRARVGPTSGFRSPLYPALPLLGIAGCLALAAYQLALVPLAAVVVLIWLAAGGALYAQYFRRAAVAVAARAEAVDESLVRLRGREPLILVPIANPARVRALMSVAHALAARGVGRVLALGIGGVEGDATPEAAVVAYDRVQGATRAAVEACAAHGRSFEGVVRVEQDVPGAIAAVVRERRPEALLLGMSRLDAPEGTALLDRLIEETAADIAILQAPAGWELDGSVRRVLVPVGGLASHDRLRARVIGALSRGDASRTVTLLRILRPGEDRQKVELTMAREAEDMRVPAAQRTIVDGDDAAAVLIEHAKEADLVVIGLGRRDGRRALIGEFVLRVARGSETPLLALAGARASRAPRSLRVRGR